MASTPKKKPKVREDVNTTAYRIMLEATGQAPKTSDPDEGKGPAAFERGRKGGLKGGKARASRLTASQRQKIAIKAAEARWNEGSQSEQTSS